MDKKIVTFSDNKKYYVNDIVNKKDSVKCKECGSDIILYKNNEGVEEYVHSNTYDGKCEEKFRYIYDMVKKLYIENKLDIKTINDLVKQGVNWSTQYKKINFIDNPSNVFCGENSFTYYIYKLDYDKYKDSVRLVTDNLHVLMEITEEFIISINNNTFFETPYNKSILCFDVGTHMLRFCGVTLKKNIIACRVSSYHNFLSFEKFDICHKGVKLYDRLNVYTLKTDFFGPQYHHANDIYRYEPTNKTMYIEGYIKFSDDILEAFYVRHMHEKFRCIENVKMCVRGVFIFIWYIISGKRFPSVFR